MSDSLEKAILQTMVFYDLFDFPLTNLEIHDFLWNYRVSFADLTAKLKKMSEKGAIGFGRGFYFLAGREKLIKIRKTRHLSSVKKNYQLEQDRWLFSLCPYIEMIGLANTLAYGNAKPDGDIDLLVVGSRKRIFTARLFLTAILYLTGRWRHGNKIKNRYCLSFFVSESELNLQKIEMVDLPDVYLYYWLKWLRPWYVRREEIAERYFSANKWIEKFLPNIEFGFKNRLEDKISWSAAFWELLLDGGLGDRVEKILHRWMLWKIKKNTKNFDIDGTMADKTIMKFHPSGVRRKYAQEWIKKCHERGLI